MILTYTKQKSCEQQGQKGYSMKPIVKYNIKSTPKT